MANEEGFTSLAVSGLAQLGQIPRWKWELSAQKCSLTNECVFSVAGTAQLCLVTRGRKHQPCWRPWSKDAVGSSSAISGAEEEPVQLDTALLPAMSQLICVWETTRNELGGKHWRIDEWIQSQITKLLKFWLYLLKIMRQRSLPPESVKIINPD